MAGSLEEMSAEKTVDEKGEQQAVEWVVEMDVEMAAMMAVSTG